MPNNPHKEIIRILQPEELDAKQIAFVRNYFSEHVRAEIFPVMLDKSTQTLQLKDTAIYLAVALKKNKRISAQAILEIPTFRLSRYLTLPSLYGEMCILFLDDVIRLCLSDIFKVYSFDTISAFTLKYTKDTESEIDNELSVTFPDAAERCVEKRKKNTSQFLIYEQAIPKPLLSLLIKKTNFTKGVQFVAVDRVHNFDNFIIPPFFNSSSTHHPIQEHLNHPDFENNKSILQKMKKRDILLNFPFHSFVYVLDLLREAAIDPVVSHIRIILFRVAPDSLVIRSLMTALQNGKDVTVFIELRARYDEEANIVWANKLRKAGARVITRVAGMKVHSKLCLITRREKGQKIYYGCIGTGNLHEKTSKLYNDIMLLTANQNITKEAREIFAFFDKKMSELKPKHLLIAPFNLREQLYSLIQQEIQHRKAKKPAEIFLKINNLADKGIQQKLIQAAKAGVKIKLIVRGICGFVNYAEKELKNIKIISVADEFIEHGRVFIFSNDGKPKYYIGSADLMTRNIDYRLEVLTPVYDKRLQKQLQQTMHILWKENQHQAISGLTAFYIQEGVTHSGLKDFWKQNTLKKLPYPQP